MKKKVIVVTGAHGQLGSFLVQHFASDAMRLQLGITKVIGIDINDVDIRNADQTLMHIGKIAQEALAQSRQCYVIHCAAAVDTTAIEADPFAYYETNSIGAKNVAIACRRAHAKMVYISTDYVFSENSKLVDGKLQEFPVNQYGLQKLIGELFTKEAFKSCPTDLLIFRSSWMFGNSQKSFVEKFLTNVFKTFAQNARQYHDSNADSDKYNVKCNVVDDAYGKPTSVQSIATALSTAIAVGTYGEMSAHEEERQISRFDWAKTIWELFTTHKFKAESMNSALQEMIYQLKQHVTIVPVSSLTLDLPMQHPGHIKQYASNAHLNIAPAYAAYDTDKYIVDNEEQLLKLMEKTLIDTYTTIKA